MSPTENLFDERQKNIIKQIESLKCEEHNTVVRYKRISNGSIQYRLQCTRCGAKVGNFIPHSEIENEDDVEPVDESLRQGYLDTKAELERELYKIRKEVESQAKRDDFFEKYSLYLQTAEWQEKRMAVLERCNFVCEGCGKRRATIAHHLTYRNWGNEFLFELKGVCQMCHDRLHNGEDAA